MITENIESPYKNLSESGQDTRENDVQTSTSKTVVQNSMLALAKTGEVEGRKPLQKTKFSLSNNLQKVRKEQILPTSNCE